MRSYHRFKTADLESSKHCGELGVRRINDEIRMMTMMTMMTMMSLKASDDNVWQVATSPFDCLRVTSGSASLHTYFFPSSYHILSYVYYHMCSTHVQSKKSMLQRKDPILFHYRRTHNHATHICTTHMYIRTHTHTHYVLTQTRLHNGICTYAHTHTNAHTCALEPSGSLTLTSTTGDSGLPDPGAGVASRLARLASLRRAMAAPRSLLRCCATSCSDLHTHTRACVCMYVCLSVWVHVCVC